MQSAEPSSGGEPTTRRDLLYLVAQAAELEHSLACQYLFTAFSLKEQPSEGVTVLQLRKITNWQNEIIGVAVQEMLHLALASNLLTAIGGAPYFRRANFPQSKTYTSLSLRFELAPFSDDTLQRYVCFELPEDFQAAQGETDWNSVCSLVKTSHAFLVAPPLLPKKLDFHSIGELYGLIRTGFAQIETSLQASDQTLFIGPPDAQATGIWPELTAVTDVTSAQTVIDLIIAQGEGTPTDQTHNHFRTFVGILGEYRAEVQSDPAFQPARPVVGNPLLDLQRDQSDAISLGANVINDSPARDVIEIFAAVYEVMLQILTRYFAHTDEDGEQLYVLKSAFLNLMSFVLAPIGMAITQLPAGASFADKTAGPSFEVFSDVALLPHLNSAWVYFRERLTEIAAACDSLAAGPPAAGQPLQTALTAASAALRRIAYPISSQPNGLTWANGISQLFSPMDVAHMGGLGLDLGDYQSVKSQAGGGNEGSAIWDKVSHKDMPAAPLGPWTDQRIQLFKSWIDNGFPE
jgi:Ferritin-like